MLLATQNKATVEELAFRALVKSFGLLERVMQPYFAKQGVSGAQWGVLRTLLRAEQAGEASLRLTELSKRLLVRPPSVTTLVDRLEEMGMLTREVSPTDQRARLIALTTRGRGLVEKVISAGHQAQYERVMGVLSSEELRKLQRLLDKLGGHLEGLLDSQRS